MELTVNLFVILTWSLYAIISGYIEAAYWFYRNKVQARFKLDYLDHETWSIQRGMVLLLIGIILFNFYNFPVVLGIVGLTFSFPFLHDGAYYYFRNKIDGSYEKGWFDTSTSSTAMIKADTRTRIIMFCMAIFFYTSMILLSKGI